MHLTTCVAVVQSLSRVRLFLTPWAAAAQAPPSSTASQSLLRVMSIESVMHPALRPLSPLLLCLPSLPASGSFPMGRLFISGGHSEGASALAAVCVRLTLPHGGGRRARGGCTETQLPAWVGVGWGPAWAEPAGTLCVWFCPVCACYSRWTLEGRDRGRLSDLREFCLIPTPTAAALPVVLRKGSGWARPPLLSTAGAQPLTF